MKFLFLLWITIRGTFEASVWATAVWCILYSFTNILWLQCFWVFIPIHFIWNIFFVEYVRTHTKQDCLFYMRRESMLVGLSIIHAIIISILPTIAAIVLLSLLEVWTHLETHWLHTWLFVACVVYILSRASGKRTTAVPNDFLQSDRNVREVRPSRGIFAKHAITHVVKPLQSRRGSTNNDRHQLDA
jgi:hypothetical protein